MKNPFIKTTEADRLKALKYTKVGMSVVYSVFRYALLISIGFIILYPLLYMVVTSIMSPASFNNSTRVWIPTGFNVADNYAKAVEALSYGKSLFNTFKYGVGSALIEVAMCAVIGYGFARFNFKGKKIFTAILFITIIVPDLMLIIPKTTNFANLDFIGVFGGIEKLVEWVASLFGKDISGTFDITPNVMDTGFTMWLPSLFGVGLRSGILIYIYIQFFSGLPRELEEAAWVDGAGPFKTFLRIAVPSSSVVFITVSVFSIVWHWNDNLLATMYLTDNRTLAVAISSVERYLTYVYSLGISRATPQGASILMASCILFIVPMLIFYMIVQRGFIESIDRVGITG